MVAINWLVGNPKFDSSTNQQNFRLDRTDFVQRALLRMTGARSAEEIWQGDRVEWCGYEWH